MIARQRQNLRQTFAANETQDHSDSTRKRLAKTQQELLEATREFAAGASRFGSVDPLNEAALAMDVARGMLDTGALAGAQEAEQQALAGLVRARRNVRKMLSDANSASSSQCRSFDHQQAQKLRRPKSDDAKNEDEQQLAQIREQVEQLAQQQREWSEDVRSGSGGFQLEKDPSQPQDASAPGSSSQQQSAAQRQQQSLESMRQLQEQLKDAMSSSALSEQQLDNAAQSIEDSAAKLADDPDAAATAAEKAAEQLDDLSEHLAALNTPDFGERIGIAQRLTQRLADRQHAVAEAMQAAAGQQSPQQGQHGTQGDRGGEGSRSAAGDGPLDERQRALAAAADRLAEVLARLGAAALEEDQEIRTALENLKLSNPPQAIAEIMRDAADELEERKLSEATQSAQQAERAARNLASGLRDARRQYAQPRLEDLIAVEAQIAELAEQAEDEKLQRLVAARIDELEQKLRALARRDRRLAESFQAMQANQQQSDSSPGAQSSSSPSGQTTRDVGGSGNPVLQDRVATQPGLHYSPTVLGGGLRDVAQVLQDRIQEVILAGVLSESDESVPLQYRDLVERYYKTLSDDLR